MKKIIVAVMMVAILATAGLAMGQGWGKALEWEWVMAPIQVALVQRVLAHGVF